MSRPTQETITCPKCGHAQAFAVWPSVNATLNLDERRKLLDGELSLFRCGACGHTAPVIHPLLYHDTERRFMAWMVPPHPETGVSQLPEEMPPETTGLPLSAYTLRHVTSPNRLIEKVLIFDHWLDDRVIEIVKVILAEQTPQDAMPAGSELLFADLITDEAGVKALAFTVLTKRGQIQASVPMDPLYTGIAEAFGPRFPDNPPGQWVNVDRDYALSLAVSDETVKPTPPAAQAPSGDGDAPTDSEPKKPGWRLWG